MSYITGSKLIQHCFFDYKPITADIFLTNFCNNRCPYCTYGRWDLESKLNTSYLHFEDFVKYANRLIELGVKGFILTGGGEPTINPDFDKITNWLEEHNIDYGINTNFNVLKLFRPNYLKVSLDAYDENSYKAYRGVNAYEKVRKNIIEYDKWRKENNVKTTLGIQMVASNVELVNKFYYSNRDLPVDYIVIRPMESTCGQYYKNELSGDSSPEIIISVIKTLASIDSRIQMNYKWEMLKYKPKECYAQWSQIAINENGQVMYCCQKPYEIVGHIMDEDILEKKALYKTDLSKCDVPCRLSAPNKTLEMIKESSNSTHLNFI